MSWYDFFPVFVVCDSVWIQIMPLMYSKLLYKILEKIPSPGMSLLQSFLIHSTWKRCWILAIWIVLKLVKTVFVQQTKSLSSMGSNHWSFLSFQTWAVVWFVAGQHVQSCSNLIQYVQIQQVSWLEVELLEQFAEQLMLGFGCLLLQLLPCCEWNDNEVHKDKIQPNGRFYINLFCIWDVESLFAIQIGHVQIDIFRHICKFHARWKVCTIPFCNG